MLRNLLVMAILLIMIINTALAFSVAPAKLNISATERKEQTYLISVYNSEKEEILVKATATDFRLGGKDKTKVNSCASFTKISPVEFKLKSGELQKVRVTILPPAESRGQYNALVSLLKISEGGKSLNITSRIAVPILLSVTP